MLEHSAIIRRRICVVGASVFGAAIILAACGGGSPSANPASSSLGSKSLSLTPVVGGHSAPKGFTPGPTRFIGHAPNTESLAQILATDGISEQLLASDDQYYVALYKGGLIPAIDKISNSIKVDYGNFVDAMNADAREITPSAQIMSNDFQSFESSLKNVHVPSATQSDIPSVISAAGAVSHEFSSIAQKYAGYTSPTIAKKELDSVVSGLGTSLKNFTNSVSTMMGTVPPVPTNATLPPSGPPLGSIPLSALKGSG